ncbi:MAG: NUDIX hydrolase [Alphaproteobacteria bacterium]|nr:NUDIX hydrolase [Pseudomonadota bacterium]
MARYPKDAGPIVSKVPEGDNRARLVCEACGFIHYHNPKVVVGAVCGYEGKILLCRRAIEPRTGFWTIPAGYLELNETSLEGAAREALEEAKAEIEVEALLAVYNIPRIGQLQLIYRARLENARIGPGPESLETRLFDWREIPWDELAFPSTRWALEHFRELEGVALFQPRTNPRGETGDFAPGR